MRWPCGVTILVLLAGVAAADAENLDVPAEKIGVGRPDAMMRRYLLAEVERACGRWKDCYEKLKTPEHVAVYQKQLRAKVLEAIGGLPEPAPLNPQVVGTVVRPGYRVEKIIFESRPKHFVSALLFVPTAEKFKAPYPGVLVPCGHAASGKAGYQSMGALLALNGMVALVFDPIDQGERGQYHANEARRLKLSPTAAHTMVGVGCILLGQNTARFEIWDGMRAIDYLQSRPEVDPKRIGCTGSSGGGTQTSYLMALDDRIIAAAPSCYLTSMEQLLKTAGPQDAEQNIFGQLAFGLDHADWIMLRAPSPVLMCTATKDFFDIRGSWDSFRYAKRLYTRLGSYDRVDLLEDDAGHSYDMLGAARWLSRWLLGKDLEIARPQIALLDGKESQCAPDGRVMALPGARSTYDFNVDYENQLAPARLAAWAAQDKTALLARVRSLAGVRKLSELPKPKIEPLETIARTGYTIEKLVIRPEDGIALPALWFSPAESKPHGVVLYVHHQGKAADAAPGGPIEQLVRAGNAVLAVDLRGAGQTQSPSAGPHYTPEYQDAVIAYLLGRSYVGMRAEDVLTCARYAAERVGGRVELIAVGNVGIAALHAAALEPTLFAKVRVSQMLISWSTILHERASKNQMPNVVHGALKHYDLPELATALGNITVQDSVNAAGEAIKVILID
jgi:dienelactone hydrolase